MEELLEQYKTTNEKDIVHWYQVGCVSDFPQDGGACIKYKEKQIAVFQFGRINKWYACQNLCPHKLEMVISRGMIGDKNGIPKVACPLHKKSFSLQDGSSLNGEGLHIAVYPVRIENEKVYIGFAE